jgi:hypothetical protein
MKLFRQSVSASMAASGNLKTNLDHLIGYNIVDLDVRISARNA